MTEESVKEQINEQEPNKNSSSDESTENSSDLSNTANQPAEAETTKKDTDTKENIEKKETVAAVASESVQEIINNITKEKGEESPIDILKDVEVNVKIELGRTRMYVEDVLKIREGSVVELDKLAGDPVDIYVNDRLIARGEVLVLNDNFCVRINQIVQDKN